MIKKVILVFKYDLFNLPVDLYKFSDTKVFAILMISIGYIIYIGSILGLLILMGKANIMLLCAVYFLFVFINTIIKSKNKYLFCLDKHEGNVLNLVLFILSGPFGLARIAHLALCLKVVLRSRTANAVTKYPVEVWPKKIKEEQRYMEESEIRFLTTLLKYQKRLKEYS